MASIFVDLPVDVHIRIFELLDYPNLVRLRMTCRELRQNATKDLLRYALLSLETDWMKAALLHMVGGPHPGEPEDILVRWGYRPDDMSRFASLLPCYDCLRLCSDAEHFANRNLSLVARDAASLAETYQQVLGIPSTRQCISCVLQSSSYLERPGARWLRITSVFAWSKAKWMVVCRACGHQTSPVERSQPPARQRMADLCDPCFKESHQSWFNFESEIALKREELRQQIERLWDKHHLLTRYRSWMDRVDNGWSVLEGRPEDLDGLDMPNWEEIRPDALTTLPTDKKSITWPFIRRS